MVRALDEGVIDVVVSDHNPQDVETKRLPFAEAADGALGIETLLGASLRLVHTGDLALNKLIAALTVNPARILGREAGRLAVGAPADLVLIDPDLPYVLDKRRLKSRSKNSPFDEARLQVAAVLTPGFRADRARDRRSRGGGLMLADLATPAALGGLALGYALGSIPFGLIFTRFAGLGDVRAIGSGNIARPTCCAPAEGPRRRNPAGRRPEGDGPRADRPSAGRRRPGAGRRARGLPRPSLPGLARVQGRQVVATFIGVLLAFSPPALAVFALIWLGLAFALKYSSLAALAASAATPLVRGRSARRRKLRCSCCSACCYGGSTLPTSGDSRPAPRRIGQKG